MPDFGGTLSEQYEEVTCPVCRLSFYGWEWNPSGDGFWCNECEASPSEGHLPSCPFLEIDNSWAPRAAEHVAKPWSEELKMWDDESVVAAAHELGQRIVRLRHSGEYQHAEELHEKMFCIYDDALDGPRSDEDRARYTSAPGPESGGDVRSPAPEPEEPHD